MKNILCDMHYLPCMQSKLVAPTYFLVVFIFYKLKAILAEDATHRIMDILKQKLIFAGKNNRSVFSNTYGGVRHFMFVDLIM